MIVSPKRLLATFLASALLAGVSAGPVIGAENRPDGRVPADPGLAVVALFEDGTVSRKAFDALSEMGAPPAEVSVRPSGIVIVRVPESMSAERFASRLASRPDVIAAAPSFQLYPLGAPDDPAYPAAVSDGTGQRTYLGPVTEHPFAIGLEPVWEQAFGAGRFALAPEREGVTIALIDTGVTPPLREETGEYVFVWDYVRNDAVPDDETGHGTRVASVMRAQTGNAFGIAGVLGSSPNRVLVYKTLSATRGDVAWTVEAMLDASARGARIINLSLGAGSDDLTASQKALLDAAVAACRAQGSLVIAASGNAGTRGVYYPAASPGAIAVGAIDHLGDNAGQRWASSSWGPELGLTAPGNGIWAVGQTEVFGKRSGTSYATPLVSGTAALLWSLMPGLSAEAVESLLLDTADGSVGPSAGFDIETGHGKLDALAAFERLATEVPLMAPVHLEVTSDGGFEHHLSWSVPPAASDVFYRYGASGGPTYTTTATSATAFATSDGSQHFWVRAYAADRWPAAAPTTVTVDVSTGLPALASERIGGQTRYETSARVSLASLDGPAPTAVLASGADWPDALAAGPLAYALGAPVLITHPARLSVEARDELLRLDPGTVILIGGTSALSADVESQIGRILPAASVTRLAGADRYETAAVVADVLAAAPGVTGGRAFIASGYTWPDALAASPAAARSGSPILLVRPGSIPEPTRSALDRLTVTSTVVVGGTAVVWPEVAALLPAPVRLGGPDRYATARAVSTWAAAESILPSSGLGIVSGVSFADALVAAPLLAARGEPVMLGDRLRTTEAEWLASRTTSSLTVFGGPSAISIDQENALKRALRPAAP